MRMSYYRRKQREGEIPSLEWFGAVKQFFLFCVCSYRAGFLLLATRRVLPDIQPEGDQRKVLSPVGQECKRLGALAMGLSEMLGQ